MNNKQEIISLLVKIISEKVAHFQELISGKRESNNDTKSSMGDKYETSREMLQQEINLLQKQLSEVVQQQKIIQRLSPISHTKVSLGALVHTSMGIFFIASGMGEFIYKGNKITSISAHSPLAMAMFGKEEGETFTLNNKVQKITTIN